MKKIGSIIILILIYSIFHCQVVFANPNSSKGFAEYDEQKAQEENQKMVEEQKKEQQERVGKSTNNYLESLEVEGLEISPQFDKQILEYTIKGEIQSDQITIKATASDEKATIQGTGNIKLQEGQSQYRVDVIAESRTVRTYIIEIEKLKKTEQKEETIEETIEVNEEITPDTIPEKQNNYGRITFNIIAGILILIIIISIVKLKKPHKKNKNRRRK